MRSCSWRSWKTPSGVEFASLGLMLIRSQATGAKTVPAVSKVMCRPRGAEAFGEFHDSWRDHRFTAGDDDMAGGGEGCGAVDNCRRA